MLLEGFFVPMTTPFYPDGRLYLRKVEHNADRYSKTPAAGLVVLSEAGEASLVSDKEAKELLGTAISAAEEQKVMLAGASRDSVTGTLDQVDAAAGFGYDGVLLKRPSLFRGAVVRETLSYFKAVADRAAVPVVLYSTRVSPLPLEVIAELAGHAQIVGLVDEVVDRTRMEGMQTATAGVKRDVTVTHVFAAVTARMQAPRESAGGGTFVSADVLTEGGAALAVAPPKPAIKTRVKTVGFQCLAASTAKMLEGLKSGATGVMPALGAAAPQACYEVYAAWKDGDLALAEEKQLRLAAAIDQVEERLGVPGIRYGSDLTGYFGGLPRLPLLPLTGAEREAVDVAMRGIRN
jgi:dihydrodipicolinate synthase/N-acetylneuraminate lyase